MSTSVLVSVIERKGAKRLTTIKSLTSLATSFAVPPDLDSHGVCKKNLNDPVIPASLHKEKGAIT
jgi:hypothetical protein